MSEEIFQRSSLDNLISIGEFYFMNLGNTTFNKLTRSNIISNTIDSNFRLNKPDALILSGQNTPYKIEAIIEYKEPEIFKNSTEFEKAIKQVAEYCWASNCSVGAVSNGIDYLWFNINSKEEHYKHQFASPIYDQITCNPIRYPNNNIIKLNKLLVNKESQLIASEIIKSIDHESSILTSGKVITDPTSLAKKVWQSIWLATGDDPKMCLMTFTEIFMYKYLSDLNIITANDDGIDISFQSTFSKGRNLCLKFYQNNVRNYIKTVFPPGADSTSIINGLSLRADKNQDELFYKILNDFNEFGNLKGVSIEFKSSLFEEFLKGTNGTKIMAQFFTPRNIVRAMAEMAQVSQLTADQTICDPACGVGGFIQEAIIKRNIKEEFAIMDGQDGQDGKFVSTVKYHGYDMDQQTIILAKASLTVLLSDYISDFKTDLEKISKYINETFESMHTSTVGSLSKINNSYDLILSNPPYVRKGFSVYHEFIKGNLNLQTYYDVPVSSKEGLFVVNIVKSLKAGGRALVVLPDGFFHTKTDRKLREFVLEQCELDAIISLPARTFYTTPKKTYILCLTKKRRTSIKQTSKVFNYIVRDVGESLDAVRVNTSLLDLNQLVIEYRHFQSHKESYSNPNNLKQIVMVDFDYYENNNMWMTEQLVDDDVKKELGINSTDLIATFDDVKQELEDIRDSISVALDAINSFDNINDGNERLVYKEVSLGDTDKFSFNTSTLGYKQKEYIPLQVDETNGYPLFTAARGPMSYLPKDHRGVLGASKENRHISIATDGDGTAGTNIMIHDTPYFLNTSRLSIEVLSDKILPEYLYYALKDIKKRFGFGYTIKCNKDNLVKYFKLSVPVDETGDFSLEYQQNIVKNMLERDHLLISLEDNVAKFKAINDFNKYSSLNNI